METRTSGSAGGLGKRTGSNPDTAPQADPTHQVHADGHTVTIGRSGKATVILNRRRQ